MQKEMVEEALAVVNGGTFVGIDTETSVTLTGGKKNPLQGHVTKRTTGATVMCFSNQEKNAYESMVRSRLVKEGKDPESFTLSPRVWGQRIQGTPFVEHNGKYYLECIFQHAGVTTYYVDGVLTDKADIDGLPEKKEVELKEGELENKPVLRAYGFDSIIGLRANGKSWKA